MAEHTFFDDIILTFNSSKPSYNILEIARQQ